MKNQLIYNNRIVLFTIALLFSLTPCKVKASLFESFGLTYEQTLNQSKLTSSCSSSTFITQKIKDSKSVSFLVPNGTSAIKPFLVYKNAIRSSLFSKVISLQLPPKYILYKQFKFDVV